MKNYRFNGTFNIEQGIPGAATRVDELLEDLIDGIDTLSSKGILPEGDIERLERAAGQAEQFLRPQSEEPTPWIGGLADAPFNGLTPAEAERLDILAEECAEVIQAIMKIKRHGFESNGLSQKTNRQVLLRELMDVGAATGMLAVDLPELQDDAYVEQQVESSLRKKLMYTHHQDADFGEFLKEPEA